MPSGRISILHDDERTTRVLTEHGHNSGRDATALDFARHVLRQFVSPLRPGANRDGSVMQGHAGHYRSGLGSKVKIPCRALGYAGTQLKVERLGPQAADGK